MERPSRGRAHTFTGAIGGFFKNPFKAVVARPDVPNDTIGWRPNTMARSNSGLSPHHALGSKPSFPARGAHMLKRHLTSQNRKVADAPEDPPQEMASPGDSCSSSQRIAVDAGLLRPSDVSPAGNKLRGRAPSPYPASNRLPVSTPVDKPSDMTSFGRIRAMTTEHIDDILYAIRIRDDQYLAQQTLPPPGSTPADIGAFWTAERQRRQSDESFLSNPEALDDASDVHGDAESITSFGTDELFVKVWDCETAYDSATDEFAEPLHRQHTPAATRPPLVRHAGTWPRAQSPDRSVYLGAQSKTDPSWLPTDPSAIPTDTDIPVPQLRWTRGITASGIWYLSSVRPPRGVTAGGPEGGTGGGGPSHTPMPGYYHSRDARFGPVDAGQLRDKLKLVAHSRPSQVGSAYDERQERIRSRYAAWEGGVTWDKWIETTESTEEAPQKADANAAGGVDRPSTEKFPDYQSAELAFAALAVDDTAFDQPKYYPAEPTNNNSKPGRLPMSKTHRERAASRRDTFAAQPLAPSRIVTWAAVDAQVGAMAKVECWLDR